MIEAALFPQIHCNIDWVLLFHFCFLPPTKFHQNSTTRLCVILSSEQTRAFLVSKAFALCGHNLE